MIPKAFIEELRSKVNIVDVVAQEVLLENNKACCPFNEEKTPSFTVKPIEGTYACYGCGARGDSIQFIVDFYKLNFNEAVQVLADMVGLEVPNDGKPVEDHSSEYARALSKAHHHHDKLRTNCKVINYLKSRDISGASAMTYILGASGNLITCPIRDIRGRVVGFSNRTITDSLPKYKNSAESPIFKKHQILYGLYEMNQAVRKPEFILVVEGQMDVVMLSQHGIPNSVATLGTAISEYQLEKLFKISPKIVFCFDSDKAGRSATFKAIQKVIPLLKDDREIRVMQLPDDTDPDEYVRKFGATKFLEEAKSARTLFDRLISYLEGQVDLDTFEGASHMLFKAKPFVTTIKDTVLSLRFHRKLAAITNLSENEVRNEMGRR